MHDLILALRNASRNRRRSLVTVFALALCSAGLILFAGYVTAMFRGDETRTTDSLGHLQIFCHDFPEKGMGSPANYVVEDHETLKQTLLGDPTLGPMIKVLTGQLTFMGLASNFESETSAAIIGFGVYPREYEELSNWNPYRMAKPPLLPENELLFHGAPWVDDGDPQGGCLGIGLAEVLEIDPPNAPDREETDDPSANAADGERAAEPRADASDEATAGEPASTDDDLPNFAALEAATAPSRTSDDGRPTIELLCAPKAGAAPNVQTLKIRAVRNFAAVELDDRMVLMHIDHASQLLFPGQPTRVTSLQLLLHDSDDVDAAAARIREILAESRPDLECRTWIELAPFYTQITAFLRVIFLFMFAIIASIVIFTIYNTLAAAIVERTFEIGTLRAMGVNRMRIASLFIYEAVFMGIAGGLLGVALAIVIGTWFNHLGVLFNPPGTSYYTQVEVMMFRHPVLLVYGFLIAVVTAVASAVVPSVLASRMPIIDALRHA